MTTRNPKMQQLLATVAKIGRADVSVLILGETGTGKELLAQRIRDTSRRKNNKYVKVNCAAIPETLIESELFGHTRGSFTGASQTRAGLFEYANHGTVFLDEIGDLNASAQTKLLRFAQDGTFRKVGGNDEYKTDVRLISATNRDLNAIGFRKDLYYRLAVVVLEIPPLRERRDDIMLLAVQIAGKYAAMLGVKFLGFAPGAVEKLVDHAWPGNVRELENVVQQALLLASGGQIAPWTVVLPAASHVPEPEKILSHNLAENEKILIRAAMRDAGGVQKRAAVLLGISARALNYKLNHLGLR